MENVSTAWLTTNYTCNFNCDWCYARKILAKDVKMEIQNAEEIIRYLKSKRIKTITLIGGEPTIYPNIIELISYIKNLGIQVRMATNGIRFKDIGFSQQIINAGIDGINISIKGATEQRYNKNVHRQGLEDALKGYQNLISLGFNPCISYVITNDNEQDFSEFVNMLERKKLDNLVIQFQKPSIGLENSDKTMSIINMGKFTSYIFRILESKKVRNFRDSSKRYPSEKCIECSMWHICGGGCFTRWFYLEPSEYIKASK